MFTYQLTFDNGKKFKSITKNLDETHTIIVKYINNNVDVKKCTINSPNGVTRYVRKNINHWHPIHNRFMFD